jgi:uncharacterized protein with HEPN domain
VPYRDWTERVEDILECIAKVQRYVEGMSFPAFVDDERTVDAVVRNVEIIGEASRHIPPDIEQRYTDVPWSRMRAIRNVLVHNYPGVSKSILWQTVHEDLPPLVPMLREILTQEREP